MYELLQASFEASAKSNKTGMCRFLCFDLFKSESVFIFRFFLLVRTWLWPWHLFRFRGLNLRCRCCTAGHGGFPSQAGSHCFRSGGARWFSFQFSRRFFLGCISPSLGHFRFGLCLHCSRSKGFLLGGCFHIGWCFLLAWWDSILSRWIVFSGGPTSTIQPLRSPRQPRTSTSSRCGKCIRALSPGKLCFGLCDRPSWTWWSWKAPEPVWALYQPFW